jgi:glycolate oxidase FAD binding subunit
MRIENENHLAEAIREAPGKLRIVGGGTRSIGIAQGAKLETAGLKGIALYEPGALTLVAGAGTTLAEVEAILGGEGQRLPFEVPDFRALLGREGASTLGGVVAANASGPRRVMVGACRDFLLGVRFVDGEGRIIKNGGRVMKNVTGYDLVKLMAGSWGRMGVLTEVALKVLPKPETEATLHLDGLSDATAVAAMSRALGSPYEVSGAAHWPGRGTFLRVEGFAGSVAYRIGQLRAMLGGEVGPGPWAEIRDVSAFAGRAGDVWRLSVKPSDAPELVVRAQAEAVVYDWGGGLVWLLTEPGTDLRARLGAFGGHATLMRGEGRVFHPEPPPVAAISAGIRAKFDPRGIFNMGLE